MTSAATVTPSNFDIGPCQVTYGSSPTDIGGTTGNVKIKFKYEKTYLHADQFGPKTNLDAAISGMGCTVETEFLETRNKTAIELLFPSGTLVGTTHKYIDFKDATAVRQLAIAQPLLLHPLVDDSTAHDNEWYFWKALPHEDSEYDFGPTIQAKMKIVWEILLDASVSPARLFRAGDHSL